MKYIFWASASQNCLAKKNRILYLFNVQPCIAFVFCTSVQWELNKGSINWQLALQNIRCLQIDAEYF